MTRRRDGSGGWVDTRTPAAPRRRVQTLLSRLIEKKKKLFVRFIQGIRNSCSEISNASVPRDDRKNDFCANVVE